MWNMREIAACRPPFAKMQHKYYSKTAYHCIHTQQSLHTIGYDCPKCNRAKSEHIDENDCIKFKHQNMQYYLDIAHGGKTQKDIKSWVKAFKKIPDEFNS